MKQIYNQEQKNVLFIKALIATSNDAEINNAMVESFTNAFEKWQIFAREMFEKASFCRRYKYKSILRNSSKKYNFKGIYSTEEPPIEYKRVYKCAFTEPIPMTHDMNFMKDFYIGRLVSKFMVLWGIKSVGSSKYYFYERKTFNSLEKSKVLIAVDVYKKTV